MLAGKLVIDLSSAGSQWSKCRAVVSVLVWDTFPLKVCIYVPGAPVFTHQSFDQ